MSKWTHIVGCLYVETYMEMNNLKEYMEKRIEDAPKITGSEANAEIFINLLSGYNSWTMKDCKNCEYKENYKKCENGGFECKCDDNFKCPEGQFQTCLAITIIGDLRDRDIEKTSQEAKEFIDYINKYFDILYSSISIYDELLGKFSIENKVEE